MRYYVAADVHGYFHELQMALEEKGFFQDTEPHQLILCGDIYDRGKEALPLQQFILDLLSREEIILIQGNHEDLALQLLYGWHRKSYDQLHHYTNGTIDTVCQLTQSTEDQIYDDSQEVGRKLLKNDYIQRIIPAMVDYFETEHYIFVHGWLPCQILEDDMGVREYRLEEDWRDAYPLAWKNARWINGIEAAHSGAIVPGKTVVCGHWHCSFGHSRYEGDGGEFDDHPNFDPYYGEGIIALDACTPISKKVNCIVIEDERISEDF